MVRVPPARPALESLGFAVPGNPVPQSEMRALAERVLESLAPELLDKMSVFDNVGIDKRHFVRPLDWYLETRGWEERAAVFADEALDLVARAAKDALHAAALPASAVDGVVVVTTTGIATPSLDARLVNRIGLGEDVMRIPVWGLGCAGGVGGVRVVTDLARAHPDKRFLLVCVETCSLAFNLSDLSVRQFVAATLFADGAAAAIVRGSDVDGARLGELGAHASHTWRDSEDVMGWDVTDEGLRVVFSRRIPEITATRFAPVVQSFAKRAGAKFDRYVMHPGGTKVLDAYETALAKPPEAFATARESLRSYGNMSSPTVLFTLRESLARKPLATGETALLAALGPGFTAELSLLHG